MAGKSASKAIQAARELLSAFDMAAIFTLLPRLLRHSLPIAQRIAGPADLVMLRQSFTPIVTPTSILEARERAN